MREHLALPDEGKPDAVQPWTASGADAWAAVRPHWFLRVWWPAAAMVAVGFTVLSTAVPQSCGAGGPCAPDTSAPVMFALMVVYVVSLVRLPWMATLCAPALAIAAALTDPMTNDGAWRWWLLAGALLWGFAAQTAALLVARRRGRLFAADGLDIAAAPSGRWDRKASLRTAGLAGVLLMAAGVSAAGGAADRPDRADAAVVAHDSSLVGRDGRFGTFVDPDVDPNPYQEPPPAALEDWYRQQNQATEQRVQITVLESAITAVPPRPGETDRQDGALNQRGFTYGWRLTDISAATWWGILAAGPVFVTLAGALLAPARAARSANGSAPARLVLVREHRPGRTIVYPADDRYGRTPLFGCDVPSPSASDRMCEAVLYGVPRPRASVALTVPTADGGTRTGIAATGIRLIRPAARAPYRPRQLDVTAAQMAPREAAVVWRTRTGTVAGDADGIHLTAAWGRRTVAWSDVAEVSYVVRTLVVTTTSGRRALLPGQSELAHVAAVLATMHANPDLRPTERDRHAPAPRLLWLLLLAALTALSAYLFL
ncbi:hypothetical protein [Streptodolium elevatio]